ncbi:MAG: DUF2390 domain-containing protein [Marinobacter sp.]|nr:DUF2390 domain-containing protein [Marinobacter sp.]
MPLPSNLPLDNPLWQWATQLWQVPDVEAHCLKLQTEGWSVTRVLTALWLAQGGQTWDGTESDDVVHWRGRATSMIRQLRQELPRQEPATAALRQGLSRCELLAEQLELALVWVHWPQPQQNSPAFANTPRALLWDNLLAAAPHRHTPEQREQEALQSLCNCLYNEQMLIQPRTAPGDASC